MRFIRNMALAITASFALVSAASAVTTVPALTGRVNDYAKVLTPQQVEALAHSLKGIEDATTDQVLILTVPSLQGEDLDTFSHDVFHSWKPGYKIDQGMGKNNGMLIVVALQERKIRIETGTGIQGAMTDAVTRVGIHEHMKPHLGVGHDDWFGAFQDEIAYLTPILTAEAKATVHAVPVVSEPKDYSGLLILGILFVLVFGTSLWFIFQKHHHEEDGSSPLCDPPVQPRSRTPSTAESTNKAPHANPRSGAGLGDMAIGAGAESLLRDSDDHDEPLFSSSNSGGNDTADASNNDNDISTGGGDDDGGGAEEDV